MRILCIATKQPWPPRDGGRLALALTVEALADAGHHVRVISPADAPVASGIVRVRRSDRIETIACACPTSGIVATTISALRHRTSSSLARHRHAAMIETVAQCIRELQPDVIHVEQLQALMHAAPGFDARIPVVLRMQNVESSLLDQAIATRAHPLTRGPFGALARATIAVEAGRLRRDERRAAVGNPHVRRIVTLTTADAMSLREAAGTGEERIIAIAPPFPAVLPAGPPLAGDPAVVISGSDWWPNAAGTRWFIDEVMPLVRGRAPGVQVHVFGGQRIDGDAIVWHPAPADSSMAFPREGIVAVPLGAASGIRMRILEAWARGCPIVATPVAARGLDVASGRELMIADGADAFASALLRVAGDGALRDSMRENGRMYLARHHAPGAAAAALAAIYDE